MKTLGLASLIALGLAFAGCGDDDDDHHHHGDGDADADADADLAQTLYVGHDGSIVSYDVDTGDERPGTLTNVAGPVDMQALEDGTIMVNLTGRNEVLAFDGRSMLEVARIPSSSTGATRPVHAYISPDIDRRRFWLALNDGEDGQVATNSALFIDVTPSSPTYLEVVGEVGLGIGHHKASFSSTLARVVISNIGDCENVMTVYDFSDLENIVALATLGGDEAGFDGADPGEGAFNPTFCDPTYQRGLPPAPHGCATSSASGKAYCNITSSGAMAVVDIDASPPTFTIVPTAGSGGGFTLAHPGGRYMYTMQETPREGDGGGPCQVGQIAITDATTDTVVSQTPLLYRGPDCEDELVGTEAETANPGHSHFHDDGDRIFVPTSGGFMVADARVDQLLVLDTSDPAHPVQEPSVTVGVHTSHSATAHSGDGRWLFDVHSVDGTVSQIDCDTAAVTRTFTVEESPHVVATFGTAEGPSEQTGPIP
jgi:hypothetical protein